MPHALRSRIAALLAGTTAVLWCSSPTGAAPDGWSLSASLSERLNLTTNPQLTTGGNTGAVTLQSTTRLAATLQKASASSVATLAASLAPILTQNGPRDALSFLSPTLRGALAVKGLRTNLTAGVNAAVSTVQFADALFGLDPNGNPDPTNSTLVTADTVRYSLTGNLGLGWTPTARDTFSLSTSVARVDFLDSAATLSPFTNASLGGSWSRPLAPGLSGGISTSLSWFQSESRSQTRSLSLDVSGNLSWQVNSRLSLGGSLGTSFTDSARRVCAFTDPVTGACLVFIPSNAFNIGATGSLSLSYATPEFGVSVSLTQGLQPSSLGTLQNTTGLGISLNHPINTASSIGISARAQIQTPLGATPASGNLTTAFRLSPTYSYQLDQATALQLGYTFTLSDRPGTGTTNSHAVFLSLSRNFNLLQ